MTGAIAAAPAWASSASPTYLNGVQDMAFFTTRDGAQIFYKDWGPKEGQPIVFHHGWPLSADDWDTQMLLFLWDTAFGWSPMIDAVMAAPARPTPATTWTPMSPM